MFRRPFRALAACAVLATATAVLTVAPAGTAAASPNCGSGTRFSDTVYGTLPANGSQMWETTFAGAVEVAYAATRSSVTQLSMYADRGDGQCTLMCWDNYSTTADCSAIGAGSVLVALYNRSATPLQFTLSERTPVFSGPRCDDDRDNDYDGAIDEPADSGCTSRTDMLEENAAATCTPTGVGDACYTLSQGSVITDAELVAPGATIVTGQTVRGHLDVYRFPVAAGASVTVPCVVLTASTTLNPCATAGGTFVTRTATLVDRTLPRPSVSLDPLTSIAVCDGRVTLTVGSIGLENFPIVTPC